MNKLVRARLHRKWLRIVPEIRNLNADEAGPLMVAFISYLLKTSTQAAFSTLGFAAIPNDVLEYTRERTLPLILTNRRYEDVGGCVCVCDCVCVRVCVTVCVCVCMPP